MEHQTNLEIRKLSRDSKVSLWKVAARMGISDTTLSKRLRKNFPEKKKQEIIGIIKELAKEVRTEDDE